MQLFQRGSPQPYHRIPNIDFLPTELRRRRLTRLQAAVIVLVALELALSYGLFLLKGPEEQMASLLRTQALQTERIIKEMAPLQGEAAKLREEIATIKKNEEEATKTYQVLVSNQRVPWSRLVAEVSTDPPVGIALKGMNIETTRLEIHGTAQSVEALIQYQTRLLSVKNVREVNINTLADKDFVLLVIASPGQGQ